MAEMGSVFEERRIRGDRDIEADRALSSPWKSYEFCKRHNSA
jgi:hypothetical protein